MAKKELIVNQFIVDGKVLKVWYGKRVPKWMQRMADTLRGVELLRQTQCD